MSTANATTAPTRTKALRNWWRRIERFLVGIGMSIIAWPLERIVLRSNGQDQP